jgi:hypothetical protein
MADRRISTAVIRASIGADGRFIARITVVSDPACAATPHAVSSSKDLVRAVRSWLAGIGSGEPDHAP